MVLLGTWVTHLFGGSAGREGTAVQLSAGLTDTVARHLPITAADRRVLLQASVAGGFGAVFGVPIAGTVFALEVPTVGRMHTGALVPALCASVVGNQVVSLLGYRHALLPRLAINVSAQTTFRVVVAALLFGFTGAAFSSISQYLRDTLAKHVQWPPLRPALGGLGVMVLAIHCGVRRRFQDTACLHCDGTRTFRHRISGSDRNCVRDCIRCIWTNRDLQNPTVVGTDCKSRYWVKPSGISDASRSGTPSRSIKSAHAGYQANSSPC